MKEMLIAFIIALVVGSIWNQMNGKDPNWAPENGSAVGTSGGGNGLDIAGAQSGSGRATEQALAGEELVVDIDEGSFQGYVLDAREPVLVEFYTDNCPHCVKMAPVLGQLAYNGQGIVRVCKINASKASSLADRYDVSGVPAFALFSEGHMLDATSGARDFQEMRAWLSQNNVSVPAQVSSNPNGEIRL